MQCYQCSHGQQHQCASARKCGRALAQAGVAGVGAWLAHLVPWSICGLMILDGIADVTVLAGGG